MTTFAHRDSLMPHALTSATTTRKATAAGTCGTSRNADRYSPVNASASPAALTMPAASMQNPTRNATSGLR